MGPGHGQASKRGELSIFADEWGSLKALRPLPVAHKGVEQETRVRQRYVDLIMRESPVRSPVSASPPWPVCAVPLTERGFLEVETPILQTLQGGASARPFVTHMNAYDIDLFLRIAPELY